MEGIQQELFKQLLETMEQLRKDNAALREQNAALTQTVANLNETVAYMSRKLYGSSSEKKQKEDPGQLTLDLFNEAETEADPSRKEPDEKEVIGPYTRTKTGKKSRDGIVGDLPVSKVICHVPEEEQSCPLCGEQMELVGTKFVREEIQIIPAKVKRIHYYKEVYACKTCRDGHDEFVATEAETPTPLIKHSLASPSTIGYIMYMKYAMYMPLYRLEADMLQHGIRLHRGTMANWIIRCSMEYLKPVFRRLHEHLLMRDIIHADEVPCQVLKEPGRAPQAKSYMWIYLTGDDGGPGIVLYDYHPGRSGQYAKEFLEGFHGYVHCDGYSGYNTPEDIMRVGCYAHLRRKFYDAIPAKRPESSPMTAAEVGVSYCDSLFSLERIYKDASKKQRMKIRLEKEKPVVDEFYRWVEKLRPVKGSKLAAAVTYAKNQKQSLMNFFKDERLELSNNAAERKAKSYVMGRKNFLFHDTVDGAEASAIVYSLVESARANGLNIYQYLYTVLLYMPDYIDEPDGIEDMMPWSEFMKERCPEAKSIEREVRLKK